MRFECASTVQKALRSLDPQARRKHPVARLMMERMEETLNRNTFQLMASPTLLVATVSVRVIRISNDLDTSSISVVLFSTSDSRLEEPRERGLDS